MIVDGTWQDSRVKPYMRMNGFHVLESIDTKKRVGICAVCGPVLIRVKIGKGRSGWRCVGATSSRFKRPYTTHKGVVCEWCGFVPRISEQLDVDHKDGNHMNDDPSNLQTLCANCHRLKNYAERKRRLAAEFGHAV